jgi:hypothetical protein
MQWLFPSTKSTRRVVVVVRGLLLDGGGCIRPGQKTDSPPPPDPTRPRRQQHNDDACLSAFLSSPFSAYSPNPSSSNAKVFSFVTLTHELAVVFYRDDFIVNHVIVGQHLYDPRSSSCSAARRRSTWAGRNRERGGLLCWPPCYCYCCSKALFFVFRFGSICWSGLTDWRMVLLQHETNAATNATARTTRNAELNVSTAGVIVSNPI